MSDDSRYFGILLEKIRDDVQVVLRAASAIGPLSRKVDVIEQRLTNVESGIKIIKAAVTNYNGVLAAYGGRIAKLEAAS